MCAGKRDQLVDLDLLSLLNGEMNTCGVQISQQIRHIVSLVWANYSEVVDLIEYRVTNLLSKVIIKIG